MNTQRCSLYSLFLACHIINVQGKKEIDVNKAELHNVIKNEKRIDDILYETGRARYEECGDSRMELSKDNKS